MTPEHLAEKWCLRVKHEGDCLNCQAIAAAIREGLEEAETRIREAVEALREQAAQIVESDMPYSKMAAAIRALEPD